ncbi:MAG TPA: PAS domain S-box protein, partial [Balneolaceae bacterium]|nr:PAS domain S-box protein [Balneolaceae bacterium]
MTNSGKDIPANSENYRKLFDSMHKAFCIIQVLFDDDDKPIDYRFLEVNASFEEQTGLKDAEGKRMRELEPKHEEHWFDIYGKVALTGEPERFEQHAEKLDDRWFEVFADSFGPVENRQVALLFNDITQRKNNERSGALLSAIVNTSDDAIISKNLDGMITSWNASAERMFGYTKHEAVGKSIKILIPDERTEEEDEILARLKQGQHIHHYETVRKRKDGHHLVVSLTIS